MPRIEGMERRRTLIARLAFFLSQSFPILKEDESWLESTTVLLSSLFPSSSSTALSSSVCFLMRTVLPQSSFVQ